MVYAMDHNNTIIKRLWCIFCLKGLFKAAKAGLSGMEKLGQYEACSNEYPQHMFLWRNNKKKKYLYFSVEKKNLEL